MPGDGLVQLKMWRALSAACEVLQSDSLVVGQFNLVAHIFEGLHKPSLARSTWMRSLPIIMYCSIQRWHTPQQTVHNPGLGGHEGTIHHLIERRPRGCRDKAYRTREATTH